MQEVEVLDKQVKEIKHSVYRMCWYMQGSVSVNEAFDMGNEDREIISKIIESNLETTKESKLPFF